ncbi:MAG: NmrA family NAD(P)-binding protein [Chitinispirillaceae bacterium]|nr:NmrA family NAD(P)-binding protein [Chitinispirillaceae bacterium]
MITITGAGGKTGKKCAEELLKRGEKIRVVGRSLEHLSSLISQGAEAMVGDMGDSAFLTRAFSGAESAYLLIPPKFDAPDIVEHYRAMTDSMVAAMRNSRLKRAVFLSSLGAERESGTGPVVGLHNAEKKLGELTNLHLVFLRAGSFYENTLMNLELMKSKRINPSPADPDAPFLMVASKDIGHKAAQILALRRFKGHSIVELFGERITNREVTRIIGGKIGIDDLTFVRISVQEAVNQMMAMGLSGSVAQSYAELSRAISDGKVTTTKMDPTKPDAPTRFEDFMEEMFYQEHKKAA